MKHITHTKIPIIMQSRNHMIVFFLKKMKGTFPLPLLAKLCSAVEDFLALVFPF